MTRLREIETRIKELGIMVTASEEGKVVMQQGSNIIEWPVGRGESQMVIDSIIIIGASLDRDQLLNLRLEKKEE